MTDNHPITPPPELVREWNQNAIGTHFPPYGYSEYIATQAARWGADQELEACLDEIYKGVGLRLIPYGSHRELLCSDLRTARRPKPPSLKEQALDALSLMLMFIPPGDQRQQGETIRRALEALPE